MANLKKSFFGGYNKSSVDTLIEELNKQINDLKDTEASFTSTIANKDIRISELSAEIDKMKARADELAAENASLKSEAGKNRYVFENVAKIYERAYNAGHDIVLDSKTHSREMLDRMNKSFYAALNNAEQTLAKQNSLKKEISSLYGKLNSLMDELTDNTDALFKDAENYISVFEEFKGIKTDTEEQAYIHQKDFEDFASEFLTAEEIRKNKPDYGKKPQAAPTFEESDEIIAKEQGPSETSSPESEEVHTVSPAVQEETVTTAAREDKENTSEINNGTEKVQKSETDLQKEQKSSEFTQFGRKSRLSSEDRDELIRKALMKNGDI